MDREFTRQVIIEKLDQLIETAKQLEEDNVVIVLLALCGAKISDQDRALAKTVQNYVRDTLMPENKTKMINIQASKN